MYRSSGVVLDLSADIKPLVHKMGLSEGGVLTFIAARAEEGTSTVARAFAHAFNEETGKKVLLIEANAREATADPGLVETTTAGEAVTKAVFNMGDGLFVSRWVTTPQGRSASGRVVQDKSFWKELTAAFDAVIIDAPALQSAPDGIAFARASRAAVLVVEAEKTRKEVIEHLRDTLTEAKATIAGVVMNKRIYHIPEGIYKRL